MIQHSARFTRYLLLSYSFVLILVSAGAGVFIHYERSLAKSFTTYSQNAELKSHVDSILFSANQRSILLVRMINATDFFKVDALNLEMLKHEQNVVDNLQSLIQRVEMKSQEEYLRQAGIVMSYNRKIQTEIYQFLMDDKREQALDQLLRVAIPVQDKVQVLFNQLKDSYESRVQLSKEQFSNAIDDMLKMIILVSVPIILSLLIIATITTRRLNAFAKSQKSILDSLEERVKERTQALLLDHNLMQNLNEAIGIFDTQDKIHLSNKKLDDLTEACKLPENVTIWQLLMCLFKDVDVGHIKYHLKHKEAWRGEATLSRDSNQFCIIDIARISDTSLPNDFFSIVVTDISDLKATQHKLEHTSNYDSVTQLPNRYYFNVTLDRFLNDHPDQPLHLMYIDLNDFKWVNDHLGHAAGDAFLFNAGVQFKKVLPKKAFIARLGGDEFAILLPGNYEISDLTDLCESVLKALEEVNEHQSTHQVGCSMGVATYPQHAKSAEDLLHKADYAMYSAKDSENGHYCIFTDQMNKTLLDLREIEVNLHRAVQNAEFEVYYQPQYRLHNLQLVGAEALVRWPTPERMISPLEFIPLAERFGLINDIGVLVMQQAMHQTQRWQTTSKPLPRIAINVSASQLLMGDFGDKISAILADNQLESHQVDIEITESVMMKNLELNGETRVSCVSRLQKSGLEISIDDFGTGYSSLAYIKHLNVDRIKIDKSFIDDIDTQSEARSIVSAIIEMGHSLGLKVLAEGIETPNQLDILKKLGCDEGQGYLFSRPLPAKEFEQKCLS
ncbi:GGDEF-domain containing protein [Hydrogenovibrio sp. SC-1]|uniref:putative bifunctional diguanylate cyclase/phosphodiesterase n=1 Tax=Hydrogenovibrio sp. SC-1 TaxID=2065820 RepID=UPI000C7BBB5A|nr:EAL domain-containing protein [Hydrogenovibrio sp. SC-1]PLA74471.1 GGDEF-domain containing protein [Hydrogenovibrio sp. SC-1]